MTDVAADSPDPASAGYPAAPRVQSSLGDLVRRIWQGALANRALISGVLLLGLLEAFFTKAPLVLVKFLIDAFGTDGTPVKAPPPVAAPTSWLSEYAQSIQVLLEGWFKRDFAGWVQGVFGIQSENMAVFVACAILAGVFGLLGGSATFGMTVLSRFFAAKIVVDLRNQVLEHVLRLPMRFFAKRRMGDLISNITTDTAVLTRSFTLVCDNAITDPLSIVFNFVLLLIWVPEISWILIVAVPLMAIPMLRTGRRIHRSSSKSLAAMGDSTESMNQMLTGIRTVKAFQLEDERLRDYSVHNANFLKRTKRMLQAKGFSQGFLFASYQVTFALLLVLMGWLVIYKHYGMGTITMAILPIATTYQHVKRLMRSYNILSESVGAMEGLESILNTECDVAHRQGGKELADVRGAVEMQGVRFAYDTEQVLHDVTFRVEPGQTVAFVGPSGAGKSTALDLIARFYDPTAGVVRVDGHDLRDVDLDSFRRHLAMVSQTSFLFNTTILDNIRYGRRDATDGEVFEAARQAYAHEFILAQEHGYETVVGEQGANLSGGQRQRITIARAILRDPRILLLDEATSALDSEAEQVVQSALDNLMKGRTSFVIAHRLPTVRSADVILVMEEGRVVERGSHEELLAQGGLYARMCALQAL